MAGRGAINFLEIDDVPILEEGEVIGPSSIIALPTKVDLPILPDVDSSADSLVHDVNASGKKWTIITDKCGKPQLLLDSDPYLRAGMSDPASVDPYGFCHRPIVVTDLMSPLGHIIQCPERMH